MNLEPNTKGQRYRLGIVLSVGGLGCWLVGAVLYTGNVTGLLPTIPYAGFVTTAVGGFMVSIGLSLVRGQPVGKAEARRTSLVIVVPALLLFCLVLLGAALVFGGNFDQPTSLGKWVGSALFLLASMAIVSALFRDVYLRFGRPDPASAISSG